MWQSRKKLDCFAALAMTMVIMISQYGYAADNPIAASGRLSTNAPIEINADTLEVFQEENRAVFSGHVVAIQDQVRLKSDTMNVFYKSSGDGKSQSSEQGAIQKIEVTGNVFLSTPQETASGERGIYDVEHQMIYLNNNVVLTRDKNVLKGSKLTYNLATGKSEIIGGVDIKKDGQGRVRALFVPDNAKDKP